VSVQFSLVSGGLLHDLLRRVGLLGDDGLPRHSVAIGLALVAWGLPGLLSILQGIQTSEYDGWSYFTDPLAYTRYLIAIYVLIATERYADSRLKHVIEHFKQSKILPPDRIEDFNGVIRSADKTTASQAAELMLLIAAFVVAGPITAHAVDLVSVTWEGLNTSQGNVFTWAGHAARYWSTPIFMFLIFRWSWRFIVWTWLLFRLSKIELSLQPLHPDRSAGLGFLSVYPSVYSGLVFAISSVAASSMYREFSIQQNAEDTIYIAVLTWIALNAVVFFVPLLFFSRQLLATRDHAILDYGKMASRHHDLIKKRWIDREYADEELLGSADITSAGEMNAAVESVHNMRLIPIDSVSVYQLIIAAGIPMIAVISTVLPISELLKWLTGTVL
jgi:hypothetical protein